MEITRRHFIKGSAVIASATILPVPLTAMAENYIDPEWRSLVATQSINKGRSNNGVIFYMDYTFVPYDPFALSPEIFGYGGGQKMSLEIKSMPISDDEFIYGEAEIAQAVKDTVRSLPHHMELPWKREIESVFDVRANCTQIAMLNRRGAANTHMYDAWYYRGTNALDAPFYVVNKQFWNGTRYAIVKHPKFEKYGFHMDKPVPDSYGYHYGRNGAHTKHIYEYEVVRTVGKSDMIWHEALPKIIG
jgi:hypothetical protein